MDPQDGKLNQKRITEGIIYTKFLYADGFSLGHGQNKNCNPVMGNIGNFSVELLIKDFSKFTVGFIPFIERKYCLKSNG